MSYVQGDLEGGMGAPTGGGGGGFASKFQPPWWLDAWKSQIVVGLAVFEAFCGILTAISISPFCMIGGILQILAAVVVLAVEAPTFVAFLTFAAPIGAFFDGKPIWVKTAIYAALAIIPLFPGCFGLFYLIGFVAALAIAAIFGLAIIGPKASRDDMRVAAGGDAYSPTMSP